jgi:hypothetical protein
MLVNRFSSLSFLFFFFFFGVEHLWLPKSTDRWAAGWLALLVDWL